MVARAKQVSIPEAIRASLLTVGTTLQEQGKLHQALTPYLGLVASHPGSDQAMVAAERALEIAETLRAEGQHHVAMMVLERLRDAHEAAEQR